MGSVLPNAAKGGIYLCVHPESDKKSDAMPSAFCLRMFVALLIIFLAIILFATHGRGEANTVDGKYCDDFGIMPHHVRVTDVMSYSFTVTWITDNDTNGYVLWGSSPTSLKNVTYDVKGQDFVGKTHICTVQLGIRQRYYFAIVSNNYVFYNGTEPWNVSLRPPLSRPPTPHMVIGKVVDDDGKPIENALVLLRLNTSAGMSIPLSARTNSTGDYYIEMSKARWKNASKYFDGHGDFYLSIYAPGHGWWPDDDYSMEYVGEISSDVITKAPNITIVSPSINAFKGTRYVGEYFKIKAVVNSSEVVQGASVVYNFDDEKVNADMSVKNIGECLYELEYTGGFVDREGNVSCTIKIHAGGNTYVYHREWRVVTKEVESIGLRLRWNCSTQDNATVVGMESVLQIIVYAQGHEINRGYGGSVSINAGDDVVCPDSAYFTPYDLGRKNVTVVFLKEGVYNITVIEEYYGVSATLQVVVYPSVYTNTSINVSGLVYDKIVFNAKMDDVVLIPEPRAILHYWVGDAEHTVTMEKISEYNGEIRGKCYVFRSEIDPFTYPTTLTYQVEFQAGSYMVVSPEEPKNYTIGPRPVCEILISTSDEEVCAGDEFSVKITMLDDHGNVNRYATCTVNVSATDKKGVVWGEKMPLDIPVDEAYKGRVCMQVTLFTAGVQDIVIYIKEYGVLGNISIRVKPASLNKLVISPDIVVINIGETVRFDCWGEDVYGNKISVDVLWSIEAYSYVGVLYANGTFVAEQPGYAEVVAEAKYYRVSAAAKVYINPGNASEIVATCNRTLSAEVNTSVVLKIKVVNATGVGVEGVYVLWYGDCTLKQNVTRTNSSGFSDNIVHLCTLAGEYYVWAEVKGLNNSPLRFEIVALPGPPYTIVISPSNAEVSVNSTMSFYATVYDQYGNVVDVPVEWSTDAGQMIGNVFKAGKRSGTGQIYAYAGSVIANTTVRILPLSPAYGFITPDNVTAVVGETIYVRAEFYDIFGNKVWTPPILWNTSKGEIIGNGTVFVGTRAGDGRILAIMGDAIAECRVHVVPGRLVKISLVPDKREAVSGDNFTIKIYGYDSYGNIVEISPEYAEWWCNLGEIKDGVYYAIKDGSDRVYARVYGLIGAVTITVRDITAPRVLYANIVHNLGAESADVFIVFSEKMNKSSVLKALSIFPNTCYHAVWLDDTKIMLSITLPPGTCTLSLNGTAMDMSGNSLQTFTIIIAGMEDCDGDGIPDTKDTDDDNDGLPDTWEETWGLDPKNAEDAAEDMDGDGLSNYDEYILGTDPHNSDTDGDGISDMLDAEPTVALKGSGGFEEKMTTPVLLILFLIILAVFVSKIGR
ncbi:MAG: hypothetical protein DRN20_02785 [Thermoplasmata archaeon]|nr:MAG: hypothetical protein DRN20_02785 [Thermoplasmata archaeon]